VCYIDGRIRVSSRVKHAAMANGSSTTTTEVEIFGAVYTVRGAQDSGYLQELAAKVDRDMRQIAGKVATVDRAKIAILAALNIADELFQSQRQREGERNQIAERMEQISGRLEAALAEEVNG